MSFDSIFQSMINWSTPYGLSVKSLVVNLLIPNFAIGFVAVVLMLED